MSRSTWQKRASGGHGHGQQGWTRASRHIHEAGRLSEELGGTDSDVKDYFFALKDDDLRAVLDEYGRKYGQGKRAYAQQVLPLWRDGRRQMSGLVAERLFNLLPPMMPLSAKYDLVRTLWERDRPKSRSSFVIGPDNEPDRVADEVELRLAAVITGGKIPDRLERRFRWLSSGDVAIHQALLNHFIDEERRLVAADIRIRTRTFLDRLNDPNGYVGHIKQSYTVGKHTIDLLFDPRAEGVRQGQPGPSKPHAPERATTPSPQDGGCLGIMVFVTVVLLGMCLATAFLR